MTHYEIGEMVVYRGRQFAVVTGFAPDGLYIKIRGLVHFVFFNQVEKIRTANVG